MSQIIGVIMLVDPKHVIDQGWVTFDVGTHQDFIEKCIQPNALDFTVDLVWEIVQSSPGRLTEDDKKMKSLVKVEPEDGIFNLRHGRVYDCMSTMYVKVPVGTAAFLTIRSTLNRLGVRMNSGIYDSAFSGNLGYTLTPHAGDVQIGVGTRVGQIAFNVSAGTGEYAGGYNTKVGEHWSHKSE